MKFRVSVKIDGEVDVTALKARALEIVAASGGITSVDGSEEPFGSEVNWVGDPERAMLMVWRAASLQAFEQLLPNEASITSWSPIVTVEA